MSRKRDFDKISTSEYVSIGELARLTGMRYSTLKFYTEEGMLEFEQEEENMTRRYKRVESIAILGRIKELKASGLNIEEVKKSL